MKLPPAFSSSAEKSVPIVKDDLDSALDEALRESFPASDPIAVNIESRAPKDASYPDRDNKSTITAEEITKSPPIRLA